MASNAINPTFEDTSTHVFSELPACVTQSCEACENGPAASRWVKEQPGVTEGRNKLVCRVCASLIVLVGKPCGLHLR
jgi:hypothetical protein